VGRSRILSSQRQRKKTITPSRSEAEKLMNGSTSRLTPTFSTAFLRMRGKIIPLSARARTARRTE
jgi:hypothetical protein